jgi:hypothetical protein
VVWGSAVHKTAEKEVRHVQQSSPITYFDRKLVLTLGSTSHLSYKEDGNDIWLTVRPDVFFLDIRDAVRYAQLDAKGLTINHLVENRPGTTFNFDHQTLKSSLDQMN